MAIGLSNNLAQAALMGRKPEEDLSVIPSQQQFAQDLNMMGATPMLAQQPVQPVAQNQKQFMNGGVQMPTGYGTVLKSPSQVMIGAGVPTMEENVAGMMSSTPGTAPTLPEGVQPGSPQANFLSMKASGQPLTPGQISQAQEQQAQVDASRAASLAGRPMEGQSYAQFMRYEDQPIQRTEQFVDPQGRIRRRATEAAVELMRQDGFDIPQGVQPLAPEYARYEQEAAAREDRIAARPDFMVAQPVESRAGQIMSFSEAKRQAEATLVSRGIENPTAQQVNTVARALQDPTPEAVDPLDRRLKELEIAQAQKELLAEPEPKAPSAFQEKLNALIATGVSLEEATRRALGEEAIAQFGPEGPRTFPREGGTMVEVEPDKFYFVEQKAPGLSVVQEELEKGVGKNLAEFNKNRASARSNVKIYEDIMAGLQSGEITTGTLREQLTPALAGIDDATRAFFNPVGQDAIDRVRLVVFQSLRDTLGAQFTEAEGQRLTKATYNPALSPELNLKRLEDVTAVLNNTLAAREAELDFFTQNPGARMIDFAKQGGLDAMDVFESELRNLEAQQGATDPLGGGRRTPGRGPSGSRYSSKSLN